MLRLIGYSLFALAGLKVFGYPAPSTALTALGILVLGAAKFRDRPGRPSGPSFRLSRMPERAEAPLSRLLPTITASVRRADDALAAHERFETAVGGASLPAFRDWLLSGARAAAHWLPVALLAMAAGAVLVSPLELVSGGLGLAQTETGRWLLRQSWPRLAAKVAAVDVLGQVCLLSGFALFRMLFRRLGFKKSDPELAAAAVAAGAFLSFLRVSGFQWMQAFPLLGIQLALIYAYARTRTLLVPGAANVVLGLASLYSARMVVLLTADLGSIESLPGIPGARGVLAVLGASLGLFAALTASRFASAHGLDFLRTGAREQWERLRSIGIWWSRDSALPRTPLTLVPVGMLWGIGIYLASYLSYYAVYVLVPAEETVPATLKQTLLMPLDMLIYVFLIGAALEELIFRKGLFKAIDGRLGSRDARLRFWPAALASAVVFSAFHFIDLSSVLVFLGIHASRLLKSLMMVYGFTWAGFAGRVAAGLLLAALYERAGILLIPIIAHFTSNLLEAVGLRWGLPWFLTAVAAIFALQLLDKPGKDGYAIARSRRPHE